MNTDSSIANLLRRALGTLTPAKLYNLSAIVGLLLCSIGAGRQFGVDYGLIVAGALLLALNVYAAEHR